MKILWKPIAVAGVLGYAGGQVVAKSRRHPESILPILHISAASGVLGAVAGWGVAVYRKVPPHVYSLSVAANFAVVSGVFLGIRNVIQSSLVERHSTTLPSSTNHWSPSTTEYISSIAGGGVTGALTSIVSRYGLRSVLLTSLGGMGMGLCAQMGYNGVMIWRRKKAIQLYYQDIGEGTRRFENWTFDNFEARFLAFWHQRSESIEVETEIGILETAIAEERKKIAQLDKLLRENGIPTEDLAELDEVTAGDHENLCVNTEVS